MLKGRQFFAHEIIPVLQAANAYACSAFINSMDLAEPPTDLAVWRKGCGDTTALLVEANTRADGDKAGDSYNELSPWWQKIEWALSAFENVPDIVNAVSMLPVDAKPLPGPSWIAPALAAGGLVAVIGLGYWWVKR